MSLFSIKDNGIARHKWVKEKLREIDRNKKILDLGSGTQRYRKFCSHLEYFAQDFGKYTDSGDKKGLQIKDWEYGKIDYPGNCWDVNEKSNTFDAILCTEVIEHIPYPNETIAECSRLLKKNGLLIITAPFASLPHMTPYYFYSGYHENWFIELGRKNNFEIKEIKCNGNIFDHCGITLSHTINSINNLFLKIVIKVFAKIVVYPILNLLSKFNKENTFACTGYHVVYSKTI